LIQKEEFKKIGEEIDKALNRLIKNPKVPLKHKEEIKIAMAMNPEELDLYARQQIQKKPTQIRVHIFRWKENKRWQRKVVEIETRTLKGTDGSIINADVHKYDETGRRLHKISLYHIGNRIYRLAKDKDGLPIMKYMGIRDYKRKPEPKPGPVPEGDPEFDEILEDSK
jgi:hypothetical protein